MRLLLRAFFLCLLLPAMQAVAATEIINVDYVPLQEAAAAARSQLSADGSVAILTSRRILIVDDDQAHLRKVRALLKRLDVHAQQYTLHMSMQDIDQRRDRLAQANANIRSLPGGWLRLHLQDQQDSSMNNQRYLLHLSANQTASMEIGTLEPVDQTRLWLSGYGVVQAHSINLIPITSGFNVTARPAGADQVHVRITPWMQRRHAHMQGQHDILLGFGNTQTSGMGQLGNRQVYTGARLQPGRRIEISGAATELTLHTGQEVEIAASTGEARQLGNALLSRHSSIGKRQFVIRLKIDKK